jgi:hypothetical protein
VPGEEFLDSLSPEELYAWENRGIPSIDRASDDFEAHSDEKQDVATSLSFPLHWTSARLSWDYLFDFAVACELRATADDPSSTSPPARAGRRSFQPPRSSHGLGGSLARDDAARASAPGCR